MKTVQSYSKNPITEAIIDVRVEPRDDLTLTELEYCWAGEEQTYPDKMKLNMTLSQLQAPRAGETVSHTAETEPIGFMFKSRDERQLFQVHRDGFTVNRLTPYLGWEPFSSEARRLWKTYLERIRPRKVLRLALRNINRLDFPYPNVELKDYLNIAPDVPQGGLLEPLGNIFMQLAVPQKDITSILQITEMGAAPRTPDGTSVVLDIDLFRNEDVPQEEESIWAVFEQLRNRKNEIFEACITDKSRELIR
jgi:uncharacterized protein (TIGR04255 family)